MRNDNLNIFFPSIVADIYNNALELHQVGKLPEALELYYQVISLDPNHYKALNNIGCIMNDLHDNAQALLYLNKAKELDPEDSMAFYNSGYVYEQKKRYKLAIKEYTSAIECDPFFPSSYERRSTLLLHIGEYNLAFKDIIQAIKLIYSEYEPEEMAAIVRYDQQNKAKEAGRRFLNYGFYLSLKGNLREKIIIYPRRCEYRIVLKFPKLHSGKTIKRHLRQYAGRYKLKYDSDFDAIFTQCQRHYKDDYCDVLYMENLRFLFSTMKQNDDSPKAVCVGLYLDGNLVAGDIGVQTGRVYTSYSGYHDVSDTGSVQLIMLAQYLEENGFAFLDFGPNTINPRFEVYKYRMGAEKMSNEKYHKLFHSVNPGSENIFTKKQRN